MTPRLFHVLQLQRRRSLQEYAALKSRAVGNVLRSRHCIQLSRKALHANTRAPEYVIGDNRTMVYGGAG